MSRKRYSEIDTQLESKWKMRDEEKKMGKNIFFEWIFVCIRFSRFRRNYSRLFSYYESASIIKIFVTMIGILCTDRSAIFNDNSNRYASNMNFCCQRNFRNFSEISFCFFGSFIHRIHWNHQCKLIMRNFLEKWLKSLVRSRKSIHLDQWTQIYLMLMFFFLHFWRFGCRRNDLKVKKKLYELIGII